MNNESEYKSFMGTYHLRDESMITLVYIRVIDLLSPAILG